MLPFVPRSDLVGAREALEHEVGGVLDALAHGVLLDTAEP